MGLNREMLQASDITQGGRSYAGKGDVGDVDPCRMCEVVFGPRPAGWPSYLRRTDSAAL